MEDILEHIQRIQTYTKTGKLAFMDSEIAQDAVLRNFAVIGEATRNISEELRNQHSEIPWRQIAAFRNFVIHAYWGVKLERVWQIIQDDLPTLKAQVKAMLRKLEENEDKNGDDTNA
jgi:uncharacterized protein with HEPN domain